MTPFPNRFQLASPEYNMHNKSMPDFPPELIQEENQSNYSEFKYFYSYDYNNIDGFVFAVDVNLNVFRANKIQLSPTNNIICESWKNIKPKDIYKWNEVFKKQYNYFKLLKKQKIIKSKIEILSTDFQENPI